MPASATGAGAIIGSVSQLSCSAIAIAPWQRRREVADERIFDAKPSYARQPTSKLGPADLPGQVSALLQVAFTGLKSQ